MTRAQEDVRRPYVPSRSEAWRELGALRDGIQTWARRTELRRAPRGRGQPALLIRGFRTGDGATRIFRNYLDRRGFWAESWGLGRNHGRVSQLLPKVIERAEKMADAASGPIALVGTSLGGFLAREVARDRPDLVRRVVTLGSPVVGGPKYTQAGLTYRRRGYDLDAIADEVDARYRVPIRVPVTAIYSPRDGVVAWPACIDHRSPDVEHVEIDSTHVGLLFHIDALLVTAARLARDPAPAEAPTERSATSRPIASSPRRVLGPRPRCGGGQSWASRAARARGR